MTISATITGTKRERSSVSEAPGLRLTVGTGGTKTAEKRTCLDTTITTGTTITVTVTYNNRDDKITITIITSSHHIKKTEAGLKGLCIREIMTYRYR